jgi:hypothetical protein
VYRVVRLVGSKALRDKCHPKKKLTFKKRKRSFLISRVTLVPKRLVQCQPFEFGPLRDRLDPGFSNQLRFRVVRSIG